MGTSWISRKGGILEKGEVDLEMGGYDPPYQLCLLCPGCIPEKPAGDKIR